MVSLHFLLSITLLTEVDNHAFFVERELVLEIDRLKHRSSSVKNGKKTNKHIENLIKCLEEERNYWKSEADGLSKLLKLGTGNVRSRSISPSRKASTKALQEVTIAITPACYSLRFI